MSVVDVMFSLLRNEFKGEQLQKNVEYDIKALIGLSAKHDLAHLVADALLRNNIIKEGDAFFDEVSNERLSAVCREIQRTYHYDKITSALEKADIDYIPLKGVVISKLYPEEWMRTSCDIDILVHEKDIPSATEALIDEGYETNKKKTYHDVSFHYDATHLELHFNICEKSPQVDELLLKVWDNSIKIKKNEFRESNEFFAFHHVAHMFYHFVNGGCGIRPFLDFWIMREKCFFDEQKLIPFIKRCQLEEFYGLVIKLCEVWFDGGLHNNISLTAEKYIISNGAYGEKDAKSQSGVIKHNGKFGYIFALVFPSYGSMCINYPVLKKWAILLPIFYVVRFFQKAFGKDRKKNRAKLDSIVNQSEDDIIKMRELFDKIGYKNSRL